MKFLLTSAGVTNGSIEKTLLGLLGKPLNETKVAFVPTAASHIADDKQWLVNNLTDFTSRGISFLDIVDIAALPKANWMKRFAVADVLCFGGGDEQYLAQEMRESGLAEVLPELLKSRVYMGISAGSMVVGHLPSQEVSRALLPEEIFEGSDPGLQLLNLTILPHLNSDYFAHLRVPLIKSLTSQFFQNVYALDDNSALKVIGGEVKVVTEGEYLKIER